MRHQHQHSHPQTTHTHARTHTPLTALCVQLCVYRLHLRRLINIHVLMVIATTRERCIHVCVAPPSPLFTFHSNRCKLCPLHIVTAGGVERSV